MLLKVKKTTFDIYNTENIQPRQFYKNIQNCLENNIPDDICRYDTDALINHDFNRR